MSTPSLRRWSLWAAVGLVLATCVWPAASAKAPASLDEAGRRSRAATAKVASAAVPSRLADREFWRIVEDFSEPDGTFQSDNLVSNERPFQHVVPLLRQMKRGGVYLGVAPDQNFTYIVALEPAVAFILDIRRGNLLAHLMYKAIFELSETRADFLSRLFSRPRPRELPTGATTMEMFAAFDAVTRDDALYRENLRTIQDHLTRKRGFGLTATDLQGVEYVYNMFFQFGPNLTYSSSSGRGGRNMPTYAELQQQTDLAGANRAYLASEENFKTLKTMEERNLIVPIVGNFAGPKALRAIGRYVADHHATITAYYTSNVEQYLFQSNEWRAFYANVAALPTDEGSTFIRSARGASLVDPIRLLLKDVSDGKIQSYADVTIRGAVR